MKQCSITNCNSIARTKGLCKKHYYRLLHNGDPNIVKRIGCCEVGASRQNKKGYILLKQPNHPNSNSGGWVFEHVFVMSQHINRQLLGGETVHHKNGVKKDNRLDNLELWVHPQATGQRVTDQLDYMVDFIVKHSSHLTSYHLDRLLRI